MGNLKRDVVVTLLKESRECYIKWFRLGEKGLAQSYGEDCLKYRKMLSEIDGQVY